MVNLHVDESILGVSPAAWDTLVGEGSPFLEHVFLAALEESGSVGGVTGWEPVVITAWLPASVVGALASGGSVEATGRPDKVDARGTLVGGLVAWRKRHSFGEFVYDWRIADWAMRQGVVWYPKLVAAVPFSPVAGTRLLVHPALASLVPAPHDPLGSTPAVPACTVAVVQRALLDAFVRAGARDASCNVLFPDDADARFLRDAGWAERLQTQYHWTNQGFRSYEDFLATLPSKRRNSIRRERKQGAATVDVRIVDGTFPGLAGHLAEFYGSTAERYTGERGHVTPAFFEILCARWAHRVHAVLALDGANVVAGTFNVQKGRRLYGRWWGCREERPFLHFEVALYRAIEACIKEGWEAFEPGHGGEHKRARGFVPTLVRSFHRHRHPGADAALRDYYTREADAVRARLLEDRDPDPA